MNLRIGQYVEAIGNGEKIQAYIPPPLPPNPSLRLDNFHDLIEKANRALGRLDSISTILPDFSWFIYFYVRKEAVLSSQIEGTQSSLSDLLLFESDESAPLSFDDVREVVNYVRAIEYGMNQLKSEFPLSLRLFKEIHAILLSSGRGEDKRPGNFRNLQNWITGKSQKASDAIFVPPPQQYVLDLMSDLERFLHRKDLPFGILVKAALAHVQFETIHPFLDGNGRLGRLLITFLLCMDEAISEPILYLSLYFKNHREEYYSRLQRVRENGEWEEWIEFFLTGVKETANQAFNTAKDILNLFKADNEKIETANVATAGVIRVYHVLQQKMIVSIADIVKQTGLTHTTISKALNQLEQLEIVQERTGKKRGKRYVYREYFGLLNSGTEPL